MSDFLFLAKQSLYIVVLCLYNSVLRVQIGSRRSWKKKKKSVEGALCKVLTLFVSHEDDDGNQKMHFYSNNNNNNSQVRAFYFASTFKCFNYWPEYFISFIIFEAICDANQSVFAQMYVDNFSPGGGNSNLPGLFEEFRLFRNWRVAVTPEIRFSSPLFLGTNHLHTL